MNTQKVVLIFGLVIMLGALSFGLYYNEKTRSIELDKLLLESTSTQTQNMDGGSLPKIDPETKTLGNQSVNASPLTIDGVALKTAYKNSYTVAFVGDQGVGTSTDSVYQLIKKEGTNALVILGDYDYIDNPDTWYKQLISNLGANFPIIPVIGNHDEKKWPEYQKLLSAHLKRTPEVTCEGTIGVQAACKYRDMRVIVTAPGIDSTKISSDAYAEYIKKIAASRNSAEDMWNICSWHKNQKLMQLGEKPDEVGWKVYEACREYGFPVITAHEHSYSRSFLMDDFKNQIIAKKKIVSIVDSAGISGSANIDKLSLEKGKSFAVVSGLGGKSVRPQALNNPWWSSVYTSNQQAKYGALFCLFGYQNQNDTALCYFKNVEGKVIDVFEVQR